GRSDCCEESGRLRGGGANRRARCRAPMKAPARDFPRARVALLLSSMALLSACRTTPAQDSSEPATTEPQGRTAPQDTRSPASADSSGAATAHAGVPTAPAPEPLPEDLNFERIVDLPVPSDLAVRGL